MTLTISKKLIASFLGVTAIVLVATLGLARWSFESGFSDFLRAVVEKRLETLADSLTQYYISDGGSWSEATLQRFDYLLHSTNTEAPPFGGRGRPRSAPPRFGSPPNFPPQAAGHPRGQDEKGRHMPPAGGFPPPPGIPRGVPPTALFNTMGERIAGIPLPQMDHPPVIVPLVVEGEFVGELRSMPPDHLNSTPESAFSRQQIVSSLLIALVSLLLAGVVSWFLSRVFLSPIRRTISGLSRLSSGDYTVRLDSSREDEFGKLMRDLDRLAHKLEENRSSRKRWLADISHELRTPVTVLTGEIETLKDGIRPLDMQRLLSLDHEVARLRHLIDDLYELSLSDIGGLRYAFSPIAIDEFLSTVVSSASQRAKERDIALLVQGKTGKQINADSQRLNQLFTNLIENSLAYTNSPGRVEIALSVVGEQVSIRIEDTPPGVNDDECDKLFDPLYRHDASRSRRSAGAGLGLAICKNIVEAHQGRITASPSRLGGVSIEILLPWSNGK